MTSWQTFFATQAGVTAALTGLVFVALSINLKQILTVDGLAGRAGEAIVLLLYPVVTGLLGTSPQASRVGVGLEFLGSGLVLAFIIGRVLVAAAPLSRGRPSYEFGSRMFAALTPVVLALIAGGLMSANQDSGVWYELGATLACIVSGVTDAWVLLVEIMR